MTQNPAAETTGKYLVLFREDAITEGTRLLSESMETLTTEPLIFNELGVAVVDADVAQINSLGLSIASDESPILAIEPERVVYSLHDVNLQDQVQPVTAPLSGTISLSKEYLRGYQDAINSLTSRLLPSEPSQEAKPAAGDDLMATWGLRATQVMNSQRSGQGIKVAVLDTGFDLAHPDFIGRKVTAKSFVEGQAVQDGNGHGTHCIGTACGPRAPKSGPRYGIAYEAEIFAGKVLSNQGSGSDSQILQGIEWAIANGCDIVSMSLGAPVQVGASYSRVFEAVAQRALQRGTLIIAAAGNSSNRAQGVTRPISHPANCPSIMAVAALDSDLKVANFSDRGINPNGGRVDIAGPGVGVRSSWPMPTQYRSISGTSMATPHVAGIAALHAEASGLRGKNLWKLLVQSTQPVAVPTIDVGAGLVQAP